MIKKCITYEGELLPFHQFDMDVGYADGLDRVFVIWPITICHEIDENSPLYDINKESLRTARFEIIAILEGVVESVGSTTQARTSYLPNEILWGKRYLYFFLHPIKRGYLVCLKTAVIENVHQFIRLFYYLLFLLILVKIVSPGSFHLGKEVHLNFPLMTTDNHFKKW